ncbi:hypothetical protein ACFFSH_36885 [Streptomyces filamentosus]|nr:hypothetical protein [Streptomyces filamentosus]
MKQTERFMTGGCLVLLILLILTGAGLVGTVGYTLWRIDNTTEKNRVAAEAELRNLIDHTARESAQTLRASATSDPVTLTALIGQRTGAPVITYDTTHNEFTAVVEKAVIYQRAGILGLRPNWITTCVTLTYALGPTRTWRVNTTTRETVSCLPSKQIGDLVRSAKQVLENLDNDLMTVTEAQLVLDQARSPGRLTVKKVAHGKRTTIVTAVLTDMAGTVDQCYLLTLPRPGNEVPGPVTAAPASSC